MVEKTKSSNILTINKIINAVLDDISTDLSEMQMISMASQMLNYELAGTTGFPFELYGFDLTRKYIVAPCDLEKNVRELHAYLFGEYNYVPSPTVQDLSRAIVEDTGKGVGDEQVTGVSEDQYTTGGSSQGQTDAQTAAE